MKPDRTRVTRRQTPTLTVMKSAPEVHQELMMPSSCTVRVFVTS